MGLDWHTTKKNTIDEQFEIIRAEYADEVEKGEFFGDIIEKYQLSYSAPCKKAGAKKMHELEDFEEIILKEFNTIKERVEEAKKEDSPNQRFIDRWDKVTLEEFKDNEKDKWNCDSCPLLKALNGSDSTKNVFLGMTVSSCDFRGKMISADKVIDEDLRNEAFEPHSGEDLGHYANRLEEELDYLSDTEYFEKDPYEVYLEQFNKDPWMKITNQKPMTEVEYDKRPHWREENINAAIHWLRTLEKFGLDMDTSY